MNRLRGQSGLINDQESYVKEFTQLGKLSRTFVRVSFTRSQTSNASIICTSEYESAACARRCAIAHEYEFPTKWRAMLIRNVTIAIDWTAGFVRFPRPTLHDLTVSDSQMCLAVGSYT